MRNFLKFALMALVLFVSNSAIAQTPPPPLGINSGFSTQSQVGNNDNYSLDDAFYGPQDSNTWREEVHFMQMNGSNGTIYKKATLEHRVSLNSNRYYTLTVITSGEFYGGRSSYESNSSFSKIPEGNDWD